MDSVCYGSPFRKIRVAADGCGSNFRYSRLIFLREIQQPFLGEGIGLFCEAAAAFRLGFQGS
jgi:hypothetical protein